MIFRPFRFDDLRALAVQHRHRGTLAKTLEASVKFEIPISPLSFTACGDGRVLACVGATPDGGVWAFLAEDLRRHMVPITRHCRELADMHYRMTGKPLYASIDGGHPEAVRWARLGGFQQQDGDTWVRAPSTTP